MKLFLLLALVGTALAIPNYHPIYNYHEVTGIPEAARIKAAEQASDFDGSRIVGGSAARLGQFPFMGGLIVLLQGGRSSVCGSSLLTNTRLVTAAHCWFDGRQNAQQFTVVLGSVLIFSGGTRFNTNQVVIHPQYDVSTVANDIAMIAIPHVTFSATIRAINLPTGAPTFVGQVATAAGFGLTGDGHVIAPNQFLSFVDLPVITNALCRTMFGPFVIDSTLCTWGPVGMNVCSSDSGGPLQLGNTLIGVTSFGPVRCGANGPSAFARVTHFVPWIRQHL